MTKKKKEIEIYTTDVDRPWFDMEHIRVPLRSSRPARRKSLDPRDPRDQRVSLKKKKQLILQWGFFYCC